MSKRSKRYSKFYAFLAPYLEKGNQAEIQLAKIAYRKLYKANWRKAQRNETKPFTVSYGKNDLQVLLNAAKKHNLKPTRFIKYAVEAYMNKRYLVPSNKEIQKILQLVAMTYNTLETFGEEKENALDLKKIQEEILGLEHQLRVLIFSPKTIEEVILEEIQKKPDTKQYLIDYLQNMHDDYQNT
jgi:uncharacterized protein YfeS